MDGTEEYTCDSLLSDTVGMWVKELSGMTKEEMETIMSIYNWIQKVFFEIYEEWHMKDPAYDRNGFHISGIVMH